MDTTVQAAATLVGLAKNTCHFTKKKKTKGKESKAIESVWINWVYLSVGEPKE